MFSIVLLLSTLVACNNPASGSSGGSGDSGAGGTGTLTVAGTSHELTKLYVDHEGYNDFDQNYDIDLLIYSEEVSHDGNSSSGTTEGSGVMLDMAFSTDKVTTGSYAFSAFDEDNSFSDFSDAFTSPGEYREYFSAGTVDLTVEGDNYTIQGSVTDDNGETVTFSYEGPATQEFQTDS